MEACLHVSPVIGPDRRKRPGMNFCNAAEHVGVAVGVVVSEMDGDHEAVQVPNLQPDPLFREQSLRQVWLSAWLFA